MLQIIFFGVGVIGALVDAFILRRNQPPMPRLEAALVWLRVWWYGAFCTAGAVMHYGEAMSEAKPNPPHILFEYVFANIGLGVLALLSIAFRGPYLMGAVLACGIFYIGAAIWDVIAMVNMNGPISGGLWLALVFDAGFPLITFVLLAAYWAVGRCIT